MEKDWLHQQNLPWQSPNLSPGSVQDTGWQNAFQTYTNPCSINMLSSVNEPIRRFMSSELPPHLKTGQCTQLRGGWFYGLPRHRQALMPIPNPVTKGLSEFPCGFNGETAPKAVPRPEEKRFLIFDQSGNQTSLIYSSLIGSSTQNQPWFGNPTAAPFGSYGGATVPADEKVGQIYKAQPIFSNVLGGNQEIGERSEMHEDTEELNALLYSDDDDDCEDDEISTGHSPSEDEKKGYNKKQGVEDGEEVASSAGPAKRKRLHNNEEHDVLSLLDTAISEKQNGEWECEDEGEDDGESSCVESRTMQGGREMGCLLTANKRLKREKIRETVSILQSIIPGGKGKHAMLVLDEAIQYLRSLKLKVKSWEETI